ncbi:glycoside hydrolase family 6 protein [Nocardioides sp. Kera G14]|uniref:glycoside hydrolase family 6 protein n=1 Tax=Nocardioides sp. Kera G14 TaxID=2884264 RepID=UPI001D0F567E|nr:glycoside hydrolase family 6 protein [Nocardioides sp. Kera G14]UDY25165.1 glycoside hydrolase family 6 protein [Nocardioides sp. Kera G14]
MVTVTPSSGDNPFASRPLYVWPEQKAGAAASALTGEEQALVQRIALTPTAIWLTPEEHPTDEVATFVRSVIAAAGTQLPVFVIYGIPARDCSGGHSSGGLDPSGYSAWVQAIGGALSGDPVVILEPDALASALACNLVEQREELLDGAIGALSSAATIYVDAGHADWVPAEQMAQMLSTIGIERTRGFSVNVSGYDGDAGERAYAETLRTALPGAHYVIDSSRNGHGATGGDWCNPADQALGESPAAVQDGTGLDAHLWIKPPGESDGTCNGGPAAGTFWPARAVALARAAGWSG